MIEKYKKMTPYSGTIADYNNLTPTKTYIMLVLLKTHKKHNFGT